MTGTIADAVVAEALTWLGTPYRHQGSRKGVGCDCLGLVLGVWRAIHGASPELPGPYAPDWAEAGGEERLLAGMRRNFAEKSFRESS
jgi:NlpC/P60 family putative phage cell wall peptidase